MTRTIREFIVDQFTGLMAGFAIGIVVCALGLVG